MTISVEHPVPISLFGPCRRWLASLRRWVSTHVAGTPHPEISMLLVPPCLDWSNLSVSSDMYHHLSSFIITYHHSSSFIIIYQNLASFIRIYQQGCPYWLILIPINMCLQGMADWRKQMDDFYWSNPWRLTWIDIQGARETLHAWALINLSIYCPVSLPFGTLWHDK